MIKNWEQFNINESVDKKVNLQLVGLDGNTFSLMGAFQAQARKEGWTKEEIKIVIDDAMSGDYNHLLATLSDHCESTDEEDEYEDDLYEKLSSLQKEYREYFKYILNNCYDKKSPSKLSDEKKKEFFDNIKKYWVKGKGATKDLEDIKIDICGIDESKKYKKELKLKVGDWVKRKNRNIELKVTNIDKNGITLYNDVTGKSQQYTLKHVLKSGEYSLTE